MSAILLWEDQTEVRLREELGLAVGSSFLALEFDVVVSEDHSQSAQATEHAVEEGAAITDHVKPDLARLVLQGLITNTPLNSATTDVLVGNPARPEQGPQKAVNAAPLLLLDYPRVIQIDTKRQLQPGRLILPQVSPVKLPGIKRAASPAQAFPGTWVTDSRFLASRLHGSAQDASKQDRVRLAHSTLTQLAYHGTPVRVVTDLATYPRMVLTSVSSPVKPEDAIIFSVEFKEFRTANVSVVGITKTRKPAKKSAEENKPQGPKGAGYALPTPAEGDALRSLLDRGIQSSTNSLFGA